MIKALAIDDEPLALELIETFCEKISFITLERTFSNSGSAFKYLEKNPIDLLFLDINMPAISGMDFYKSLQEKPMLIFTTSYSEYALESYDLNAVDYLLKPFTFQRFEKAVLKAKKIFDVTKGVSTNDDAQYLMLKVDYGVVKLMLSEILYIEGLDNYLKIYLLNQPPLVVRLTMKSLTEKFNSSDFVRVHRSYIVSVKHVDAVKHKIICIKDEEIPIGKSYEEDFRNAMKKLTGNG